MTQTEPTIPNPQPEPTRSVAYEPPVVVQRPRRPLGAGAKIVAVAIGALVIAIAFFGIGFAVGHISGEHSRSGISQRLDDRGFGQQGDRRDSGSGMQNRVGPGAQGGQAGQGSGAGGTQGGASTQPGQVAPQGVAPSGAPSVAPSAPTS